MNRLACVAVCPWRICEQEEKLEPCTAANVKTALHRAGWLTGTSIDNYIGIFRASLAYVLHSSHCT